MLMFFKKFVVPAIFAVLFFTTPFVSFSVSFAAPTDQSTVIERIIILGNDRVDALVIEEYLAVTPGQYYSTALVNDALKRLYSVGMFSDVNIEMKGMDFVVSVVESPIINKIAFEGNYQVTTDKLEIDTRLKSRSILQRSLVHKDVERILALYSAVGHYGVSVSPSIIELPDNRVNLIFEIEEGIKARVADIIFVGNKEFSDSDLLKQIKTASTGLLSWLKLDDVYSQDRLETDKLLLRYFYLRHGYIDFRILSAVAELDQERNKFFITITVDEGSRYAFGPILIKSSLAQLDTTLLTNFIQTIEGDFYDVDKVDKSKEDLTLELARLGYPFSQVHSEEQRDGQNNVLGLTYAIKKGPKAYIERINILGNSRTEDRVIRREFDISEGDPYNLVMIERAQRALRRLQFFSNVKITTERGSSADRVVLNVRVDEQPTGQFSVSGGYWVSEGFSANVSLAERNLLGRGQYVRVAVDLTSSSSGVDVSLVEPYFLGRNMSLGLDLIAKKRDRDGKIAFGSKRYGLGVSLGFPLSSNLWFKPRYQFERKEIYGVTDDASLAIRDAEGVRNISSVGYTIVFDTVDDRKHPTNGLYAKFSQDVAGIGGDVNYIRTLGQVSVYNALYKDIISVSKVQGGYITGFEDQNVSLADAFFKGGDLVRGFQRSGMGPRDSATRDSLGGKWFAGVSTEVRFPFSTTLTDFGFRGVVFADAGVLSGTDLDGIVINDNVLDVLDSNALRSSVGGGVLWDSPLGPLRIDMAYILSQESYDKDQLFRFSMASEF